MSTPPVPLFPPETVLELARHALEKAREALLWVDLEGRVILVNEAACRSLGFSREDLLGRNLFDICPELTPALWRELWKEIRQRASFLFELSCRTRDGRVFPADVAMHHLRWQDKEYACVFFEDVAERKRLQQLKDEFVSTVSHELRSPMTIIREGVSQVLEGLRGDITDEQRRALAIALTGIDRLTRIVNDLLDVSRIESGRMALKKGWFDLVECVKNVCREFAPRAHERGLELRTRFFQECMEVYADRDRVMQVLTNLVDNALKFTLKGHVEIAVEDRDNIVLQVSDTGVGIREKDLDRIFLKFERLEDSPVCSERGSGLGLSISQGIVELHGGKLWAESELGRGSRFIITLPKSTARSDFQRQLTPILRNATAQGASLSVVVFHPQPNSGISPNNLKESARFPMDRLEQLIQAHSGRKTDLTAQDAQMMFLGLPSTVKKEAVRLAENIGQAFKQAQAIEVTHSSFSLAWRVTSFPEDSTDPREFLTKALADL
jgi:PAS domain S-box-containing protein